MLVTEQDREASHALTADDADFDRLLPDAVCHNGGKTALGKIDAVDPPLLLLQDIADRKLNVFKVGFDEPEIVVGQTRQNKIGLAVCYGSSLVGARALRISSAVRALDMADDERQ